MTARTESRAARALGGWLLAAWVALLLAGCGGDDETLPAGPVTPTAVLEATRAVTASIGRAGGTLTATASDGTTYVLAIPADALPEPVQITMTPVVRIDGLPLSGGLAGAVDLQPSGTVLARPAVLTIKTAASAPAGLQLTGVYMASGAGEVKRSPALAAATGVVVPLAGFSTHGAGYGTLQDLQTMSIAGTQSPQANQAFFTAYQILVTGNDSDEMLAAYLTWFDSYVLPGIRDATDGPSLTAALADFEMWVSGLYEFAAHVPGQQALWDPWYRSNGGLGDEEIQTRAREWAELAAPKLRRAYDDNNALCRAEQSLAAMRNALFFARQAFLHVGGDLLEANGIDPESASRNLCARLVIASLTLADPLQSTVPSDLDATFELLFEGQAEGQAVPVQVSFSGTNATFGKASPANGNLQGEFTLAVAARTASEPVVVRLDGCLAVGGEVEPWVCAGQTVERNGSTAVVVHSGSLSVRVEVSDILPIVREDADTSFSDLDSISANLPMATYTLSSGQVQASGSASIARRLELQSGGVRVFRTTFQAEGLIQRAADNDANVLYRVVAIVTDNWCFTLPSAYDAAATWTAGPTVNANGMWPPVFERYDGNVLLETVRPITSGEFVRLQAGRWCKGQQGRFTAWERSTEPPSVEFKETVTLRPAQ